MALNWEIIETSPFHPYYQNRHHPMQLKDRSAPNAAQGQVSLKRYKLTTSTDQLQVRRGSVFIRPGWLIQATRFGQSNKHERQEPKSDRELKMGLPKITEDGIAEDN
jgi:hypothetical protein